MNDLGELQSLSVPPLSRRGFVMAVLMTGFTLATTRVEGQEIRTDTTGIEAGEVRIPVADGEIPAYRALPQGRGPFPVVLVVEEIFGVHEYIKDVCRRLAKLVLQFPSKERFLYLPWFVSWGIEHGPGACDRATDAESGG